MNRYLMLAILLLIISISLTLCMGPNSSGDYLAIPSMSSLLLFRAPRVLLGVLVGMGLSLSGAALQSMLRNSLASPYTLGVSSAGALGASIGIFLGFSTFFVTLFSIAMSLLSLLFIIYIAGKRSESSKDYILLVGVSLGFLCSSLIVGMQFFGGAEISFSIQKWLIGSLQTIGFTSSILLAPFLIVSSLILFGKGLELDIVQVGAEFSKAKGVNVLELERLLLIVIALIVGLIVSLVGPLSFIGLLVPQVVKLYVESIHRKVFVYSALYGASYLILIDGVSRVLISPSEIPVGVLTSLVGAPIFVVLLILQKSR